MTFSVEQDNRAKQLFYRHAQHQADQFDAVMSLITFPLDGLSILDVGCGYGDLVERLPNTVKYTGIDLNPDAIRRARDSDPDPKHKYRVSSRIVKADVIIAVAAIASEFVPPKVLLERMWKAAGKALVFTTFAGHAPMETVVGWCPERPNVVVASGDFFAVGMYK